jgi:hypothetical protein
MEKSGRKAGWKRKKEEIRHLHGTLEEQLRAAFEGVLQNALAEMSEQSARQDGMPISSWAELVGEDGSILKLTLECHPPTIPTIPSLN